MKDKLVVIVLGNRNSGKSETWNRLFGKTVRTGKNSRQLYLDTKLYVEVFLVSGSAEEKKKYIGIIIGKNVKIEIILCSVQYREDSIDTINFFHENGFKFYVHWLNPGYDDEAEYIDDLGIVQLLRELGAEIQQINAKMNLDGSVNAIKEYIYDWSKANGLLIAED